ncbi:MAG: hypothetical protein ACXW3E_14830 [Thermoanaerobaculia bacterium]
MKRVLVSACLCFAVAVSAFAIDVSVKLGDRIGVLTTSERHAYDTERRVEDAVQNSLREELNARGFDAFRAGLTYDELRRDDRANADFYVEIVSSHGDSNLMGGVAVGGGPVVAEIGVLVAKVAAEMRLYDGKTLELIDRFDLQQRRTTLAPTGIGIQRVPFVGWIAVPLVQRAQYRAAARGVARDAADRIAAGTRGR